MKCPVSHLTGQSELREQEKPTCSWKYLILRAISSHRLTCRDTTACDLGPSLSRRGREATQTKT